jgi:hypothetical protein
LLICEHVAPWCGTGILPVQSMNEYLAGGLSIDLPSLPGNILGETGYSRFSTMIVGLILPGVGAYQAARLSQCEPTPRKRPLNVATNS